jgi:WASH complex subunit 7, N-terminal
VDNILQPDDTNETFRKILVVLVILCYKIRELKDVAEEKFFPPLIMFGRSPVDDSAGRRNDRLIVAAKHKLLSV